VGAELPAAGSQRGLESGAPVAEVIFTFLFQKYAFLSIFWSKLLLKTHL